MLHRLLSPSLTRLHALRSRLAGPIVALALLSAGTSLAASLTLGLASDVSSLDPHYLNTAPNIQAASHLFETLVAVDADGKLVPGLAESWKATNATTWEFKLRKGARFSDGSEVTLDDVIFSLERPATLTQSPGPFTSFTKAIVGKKALDSQTLQLVTRQAHGTLPLDLASVFIVARKSANAPSEVLNNGKALLGSGPYKLQNFKRGESIELVANPYWWGYGTTPPPWEKVSLRLLPNDAPRLAALLAGQADLIEGAPAPDLPRLKTDPRYRLSQKAGWRTLFITLDQFRDRSPFITDLNGQPLSKNPLKDERVRRALSLAINRPGLATQTLEGLGIPAANVVSPGILGHDPALKPSPYNPEAAKALLKEAGYGDGFAITLHGPNNRYLNDDQILQTVAQFWSRIGVKTRVETLPLSVYFGRLRNADFSAGLLGWGSLAGDFALSSLVASPDPASGAGTWNWGQYQNAKADRLIQQSLASPKEAERARLAQEAARAVLGETALIPLHHQIVTWAMKKNLNYPPRVDEFTFAWQIKSE